MLFQGYFIKVKERDHKDTVFLAKIGVGGEIEVLIEEPALPMVVLDGMLPRR